MDEKKPKNHIPPHPTPPQQKKKNPNPTNKQINMVEKKA